MALKAIMNSLRGLFHFMTGKAEFVKSIQIDHFSECQCAELFLLGVSTIIGG